ncbi:MAG: lipoate protein ligase C-terminal domain-containing protein, partial [Anaerolineales bacterium]
VLHHGTLLYASTISDLTEALIVNPAKFEDKAVKSIRSRVTNISDHLEAPIPVETFIERVMEHMKADFPSAVPYQWNDQDLAAIHELRASKYQTWRWNFGRSPDYSFRNTVRTLGGTLEVHLDIERGEIKQARLFGDYFGVRSIEEIETALIGVRHERSAIKQQLSKFDLDEYLNGVPETDLINSFF